MRPANPDSKSSRIFAKQANTVFYFLFRLFLSMLFSVAYNDFFHFHAFPFVFANPPLYSRFKSGLTSIILENAFILNIFGWLSLPST